MTSGQRNARKITDKVEEFWQKRKRGAYAPKTIASARLGGEKNEPRATIDGIRGIRPVRYRRANSQADIADNLCHGDPSAATASRDREASRACNVIGSRARARRRAGGGGGRIEGETLQLSK